MNASGGFLSAITGLVAIPVMLFNFLSPFVAGIWLATLGEWSLIGMGIAYMVVGVLLISIALLPGMALGVAAVKAEESGNTFLAILLGIPVVAWTLMLAGGSCAFAIWYAYEEIYHEGSWIPYVLWAIVAATAPWDYMAMKEGQGAPEATDAMVTASFLNIGCVAAFLGIWFFELRELVEIAIPIGVCLIFAQILNTIYSIAKARARRNPFNY